MAPEPQQDSNRSAQIAPNDLPVTIYTPESPLRRPGKLFLDMIADIRASRELAWRLLVRNISVQYRQTLLGYLWAFMPPLTTTAIWVFLNSQKIVSFDSPGVPYPAFVLTGMVLWQTFVDAVQAPLRVITGSKAMLAKINFPRESLLFVAVGEALFNLVIRVILIIGVFIWFGLPLASTMFLVPFGIFALMALGITCGLLLVPIGALYQDVTFGVSLVTQFWLYLTPVVYPAPTVWPASALNWINPVSPALLATRDWLLSGETDHLLPFYVVTATTFLALFLGLLIYRVSIPILIERMSA